MSGFLFPGFYQANFDSASQSTLSFFVMPNIFYQLTALNYKSGRVERLGRLYKQDCLTHGPNIRTSFHISKCVLQTCQTQKSASSEASITMKTLESVFSQEVIRV